MARTARVVPLTDGSATPRAWKVVDISNPGREIEVSRHQTEPEAVKAARDFEGSPVYTLQDQEGEGEEDQRFMVRQIEDPGSGGNGCLFEVYNARTGESIGYFKSEDEARQKLASLQSTQER